MVYSVGRSVLVGLAFVGATAAVVRLRPKDYGAFIPAAIAAVSLAASLAKFKK